MNLFMVQVEVADLPGALAWYAGVLGLGVLMEDRPNGFALLGAGAGAGAAKVALKQSSGSGVGRGAITLTFEVRDVGAERSRLIGLGMEVADPVEIAAEGYRVIRLADPDGTPIHLFAWIRGDDPA